MEDFTSLISTLGFPIAVCCYLFWERHNTTKANREERLEKREKLTNALKDFTAAINDLKTEMIKLNERCKTGGIR